MKISRRMFLGGAGAAIALPLFESLLPRAARGAAAEPPPRRFLAFYVPNGIVMANWTPATTGRDYAPTRILEPVMPWRDKLLVVSGISNRPARPDAIGDHGSGCGAFLTATHVVKTEGADIRNGVSVDQVAAAKLGASLPFPSIELGIEAGASVGGCDSGYSCAYTRNISWANPTTPRPKLTSSRVAFDRLFAGFDPDLTEAEIQKRLHYRTSVLDYARGETEALHGKLGRSDRIKLDQYLTGVRELEARLSRPGALCVPGAPPDGELDYPDHVKFMLDLIALALRCDQTRVATFMLGNAGSNRSHSHIGVPDAHHDLSHHQSDPDKLERLTQIDRWEISMLAYLLDKLEQAKELDGSSILDHTALFFSSEIEDGNSHSHDNMPVLIAGGAGGALATGQHLRKTGGPAMADLFIALLHAVGAPVDRFGDDGTQPMAGILA
ncbi:MAG: DUF1552 domain-containing protein [Kofleriaceae bacterium]